MLTKDRVREMIDLLPDGFTFEDFKRELYILDAKMTEEQRLTKIKEEEQGTTENNL